MDRLIYTAMTGASPDAGATGGGRAQSGQRHIDRLSRRGTSAKRAVPIRSINAPAPLATRAFVVDASTHTNLEPGAAAIHRPHARRRGRGFRAGSRYHAGRHEVSTRNGSLEMSRQRRHPDPRRLSGAGRRRPHHGAARRQDQHRQGRHRIRGAGNRGAQNTVNTIGRIQAGQSRRGSTCAAPACFAPAPATLAPASEQARSLPVISEGSNVSVAEMVTDDFAGPPVEMQIKMLQTADQNDKSVTQVISAR